MDNTTCMYLSIGELECTKCYEGTYQPLSGSTSCDSCLVDTYNDDEGATECKSCPLNSTTQGSEGSTSSSSCHCSIGYWGIPGTTCTQDKGSATISYEFDLLLNTTLDPVQFEEGHYLSQWSSNIATHIGVSSNRVSATLLQQLGTSYVIRVVFASNDNNPKEITALGMVNTMQAFLSNRISIFGSEVTGTSMYTEPSQVIISPSDTWENTIVRFAWIACGIVLALLLVLTSICYKPNKLANVRPFDLFVLILAIYDVISDIVFMSYLRSHDKLLYHFISSVTFFSISLVYNTVITIALVSGETRSDEFNKWMSKNKSFVLICIVAATNVGVLNIITSNIWGLALFGAGAFVPRDSSLSGAADSRGRLLLLASSSIGSLVESVPSLVISISSIYVMDAWSFATSLSVSASVIGLLIGIVKGIMAVLLWVRQRHSRERTSSTDSGTSTPPFGGKVKSPRGVTHSPDLMIPLNLTKSKSNLNAPPTMPSMQQQSNTNVNGHTYHGIDVVNIH
jgi:hypothetical protein